MDYVVKESDATIKGEKLLENIVVVESDEAEDVTDSAETTILQIDAPGIIVTKEVDKREAKVGDTLTYTITVENAGNVRLDNVRVVDEMLELDIDLGSLQVGQTWSSKFEYKVKTSDAGKTLVNTANVKADELEDPAEASVQTNIEKVRKPGGGGGGYSATPVEKKPELNKEDHVSYIFGYDDKTVRPSKNITRAEVAAIFFRLMTDDSREHFWKEENSFTDVNDYDWFNTEVSTMSNAKIIMGYPDGTFGPNKPITRAEFAAIAARFSNVAYNGGCNFVDVPESHWAWKDIALAEHLGWISGYPGNIFRPNQNITRAEAMTLINFVLERAVEKDHMLNDMVKWSDNTPSEWYYAIVQEATNSHIYTRLSKKVPNQDFCYEDWTKILPPTDWVALEAMWSREYGK